MQARRSGEDGHRRSDSWSLRSGKFSATANGAGPRRESGDMLHSYDIEANNSHRNLAELAEDSDEEEGPSGAKRTSFDDGSRRAASGAGRSQSGAGNSTRR